MTHDTRTQMRQRLEEWVASLNALAEIVGMEEAAQRIQEQVAAIRWLLDAEQQQEEARTWQPIATAPPGLADGKWTYILFSGYSKGKSFGGRVVVSGWMGKTHDGRYEPVHSYSYKLVITHWMPLPGVPNAD